MTMTPEKFARLAIEVPFVEKGRSWSGWDCWGAVVLFHHEVLGIDLPSYVTDYADAGNTMEGRETLRRLITHHLPKWISVARPEPGDVVLLNIGGRPIHVGLALGGGLMLHTEAKVNTVIERLASPMWARRIEGFYRYGV